MNKFEFELEIEDDKTGVEFVRDMRLGQKILKEEITCKT
jgi:hypothetical protein